MKNSYSNNWKNKESIALEDVLMDSKLDEDIKIKDSFNN